jgi:HSP20 family molecular chaperone IbpA
MSENKDIAETSKDNAVAQARENEPLLQPTVDICENEEGITLWLDMPGVSKERLNIEVDQNTLVIEGESRIDLPEGMKPLYADVRVTCYRRSFALSNELDTNSIDASLKDGVLNLLIHKRPELRPRKIEVRTH